MSFPGNLCDLSDEEQEAIEEDKRLWFEAYEAVRALHPSALKIQLEQIGCELSREDMRYRLNICYSNLKKEQRKK